MLSQMAMGIETLLLARYPRTRDRLILIGAALLEFCGYRQILTLERLMAMFQIRSKRGRWGSMVHAGLGNQGSSAAVPAPRTEPAPESEPVAVAVDVGARVDAVGASMTAHLPGGSP
jgi:hypothetical protein